MASSDGESNPVRFSTVSQNNIYSTVDQKKSAEIWTTIL